MIIALLDANVLLSAALSRRGPIGEIMDAWARHQIQVVVSQHLHDEVERNLRGRYFANRVSPTARDELLFVLRTRCVHATPPSFNPRVATHQEDDQILATAVAGNVDYLVTGDRQLRARQL